MHILNTQPPQRIEYDPNGVLAVHHHFFTIQGEGPFAGTPAVFIRLHGCNLQCPGCDTDYTSRKQLMQPEEILETICAEGHGPGRLIVITGGEPFRQNIAPLARLLLDYGFRVQVETNGSFYLPEFPFKEATVVCSPKTGKIHPELAKRVHAYKYVLTEGEVDTDGLPLAALFHTPGAAGRVARPPEGWEGPIYVQPMDEQDPEKNARNIRACVESVMKHGYTLCLQTHKIAGLE